MNPDHVEENTSSAAQMSPLEALGGKEKLLEIVKYFYDHVIPDPMIGFMFKNVELSKLIEREFEFSAVLLGAKDVTYRGRGMRRAHAPHRVMGGQFERRQQLLREALAAFNVPADVAALWLGHNDMLRPQITADPARHCGSTPPSAQPLLPPTQQPLSEDLFFGKQRNPKNP